jgi:hypothetical protein
MPDSPISKWLTDNFRAWSPFHYALDASVSFLGTYLLALFRELSPWQSCVLLLLTLVVVTCAMALWIQKQTGALNLRLIKGLVEATDLVFSKSNPNRRKKYDQQLHEHVSFGDNPARAGGAILTVERYGLGLPRRQVSEINLRRICSAVPCPSSTRYCDHFFIWIVGRTNKR